MKTVVSLFREAVYNFHSPFFLRGNNWPDNWPIPMKHRGLTMGVRGGKREKDERMPPPPACPAEPNSFIFDNYSILIESGVWAEPINHH